jgi:hypothetical protein
VKSQKQREDFENSKEKSHLLQIQECSWDYQQAFQQKPCKPEGMGWWI